MKENKNKELMNYILKNYNVQSANNGTSNKNIKSKFGEFEFEVSRNRNNEFDPMIVPKH